MLQCKFKAMCTPIQSSTMVGATNLTACCIILHNMSVSDRIMEDINARYDPSKVVEGGGMIPRTTSTMNASEEDILQQGLDGRPNAAVGLPLDEVQQNRENLLQSFHGGDHVAMAGILVLFEAGKAVPCQLNQSWYHTAKFQI
jgi:hypothetical protein